MGDWIGLEAASGEHHQGQSGDHTVHVVSSGCARIRAHPSLDRCFSDFALPLASA